jgi:hypothetical protein
MNMNTEHDRSDGATLIPVDEWAYHPILQFSELDSTDGSLNWPGLDSWQRRAVAGIALVREEGEFFISVPAGTNFDLFVNDDTDEEASAAWDGEGDDVQRYYTRFTDTGFLHVGTYTAITIDGIRRYFQWGTDAWKECGLSGFLHARDDDDTRFAETPPADLEPLVPKSLRTAPERAARPAIEPTVIESTSGLGQLLDDIMSGAEAERDAAEEDDDVDLMTEVDAMVQHGTAVGIASIAHRGQLDKLGKDYIDHPARVAETFDWLDEPVHHCAAWLHDVIEDSDISAQDLLDAGMLPEIVEVVELLTRRDDVRDEDYYGRIRQHPIALAVKLADIADNTAEWRTRRLDYETQVRLSQKYYKARQLLGAVSE